MARLTWSAEGKRFYEMGVDRGVLYVGEQAGVAWTGLTSVSESPTGGDPTPYYIDGIKYLNVSSAEEFAATINAISSPPEFGPCDGTVALQNGLFVTQQPRRSFGFSYRTRVGNEVDGARHAYKIHIVYNAMAAPSSRNNKTFGGSAEAMEYSWAITTLSPLVTGYKPTAHFVIDSRKTPRGLLRILEDILYGTETLSPRLPPAQELINLFVNPGPPPVIWTNLVTNPRGEDVSTTSYSVLRTNLMTNPRPRNYASSTSVPSGWQDTWAGGGAANFTSDTNGVLMKTWTAAATSDHNVFAGPRITSPPIGVPLSASMKIRISASPNGMPTSGMALRFDFRDSGNVSLGTVKGNDVVWGALGDWMTLECTGAVVPVGTAHVRVIPLPNSSVWKPDVGTVIEMSEPLVEVGTVLGTFFDGATVGSNVYDWTNVADSSTSEERVYRAIGQQASASGEANYFPYWSEGSAGTRFQRWRTIAGTPTPSYRVARSNAISHVDVKNGERYTLLMRIRRTGWADTTMNVRIAPASGTPEIMPNTNLVDIATTWQDIRIFFTATADASTDTNIGLYCSLPLDAPTNAHGEFDIAHWAIIPGDYEGDYFDGDTPDADPTFYEWEGTPHASTSTIRSWDN